MKPLRGCVKDVRELQHFLKTTFPHHSFQFRTLLNEQATYQNIIEHFDESYLGKAKKGDVVLIQFSGHGARERAAPEFLEYFPEEKQETFVCHDSRLPGGRDLADKELGVLVERVAQQGAQVVLIMDCCHAGSATKSGEHEALGEARQWDDREEVRPLASYLDGHFLSGVYVPESRHLVLSACHKREKAFELNSGQGHFTKHLLDILRKYKGKISYAQLFAETRAAMHRSTDRQNPQLELSGFFNPYQFFLGGGGGSAKALYHAF